MWRRPFPRGGCSALGVGGGRGAPPCCVLPGVPLFRGQGPTREAARCGFSLSRGRGRSRRRWTRRAAVCPLLSRPASGVSPEKLPPPKATEVQSCGFFSVLAHLTSGVRFRGVAESVRSGSGSDLRPVDARVGETVLFSSNGLASFSNVGPPKVGACSRTHDPIPGSVGPPRLPGACPTCPMTTALVSASRSGT